MNNITSEGLSAYIQKNWFQLGVIMILAIAFIKQDVSVEFDFADQNNKDQTALLSAKPKSDSNKTKMGFSLPSFSSFNETEEVDAESNSVSLKKNRKSAAYLFIDRFKDVAQDEGQQFKIPASVIVALGLYQSKSSKAALANKANNFFAIPCTSSWEGASITYKDACYRSYDSAWFSFRDNSNFLSELRSNFGKDKKNLSVKAWTRILEKSRVIKDGHGFLKLIRKYDLLELDN